MGGEPSLWSKKLANANRLHWWQIRIFDSPHVRRLRTLTWKLMALCPASSTARWTRLSIALRRLLDIQVEKSWPLYPLVTAMIAVYMFAPGVPMAAAGEGDDKDLAAATTAYHSGDYTLAVEAFKRVLTKDPKNYTARFYLGCSMFSLGSFESAEANFTVCVALNPEKVEPLFWQARSAENRGRLETARASYRTVLALDPGNTGATQALAHLEKRALLGQIDVFRLWQFYLLALGLTGMGYKAAFLLMPVPREVQQALQDMMIGAIGHEMGRRTGDHELKVKSGALSLGAMFFAVARFKRQCRIVLTGSVAISSLASWVIFNYSGAATFRNEIWLGSAALGVFLLYKEHRYFC